MSKPTFSAVGPALGYYYQAIYALKVLFDEEDINSCVSIETLDDVTIESTSRKELHQLKHSMQDNSKISIKSDNLWKTLRVWSEYISFESGDTCSFTLSTVATLDAGNALSVLLELGTDRTALLNILIEEAHRILSERDLEEQKQKHNSTSQKEKLPYEARYKGCQSFLNLAQPQKKLLIEKIILNPGSFSIEEANTMVCNKIKNAVKPESISLLAKAILAWWDREAVESLTGERTRQIFKTELLEFISKKNAELHTDPFTDDLGDLALPALINPSPVHKKQLEIISASEPQKRRSYDTEMKARIQRDFWMQNKISTIEKIKRYDERLVTEWSYVFDEMCCDAASLTETELQKKGRELLEWSHVQAHQQVQSISSSYTNPDLIRGSYQMLSSTKAIGWHAHYKILIQDKDGES